MEFDKQVEKINEKLGEIFRTLTVLRHHEQDITPNEYKRVKAAANLVIETYEALNDESTLDAIDELYK